MNKIFLTGTLLLFLSLSPAVLAHKDSDSRLELKIMAKNNNRIEVEDQKFEIRGEITAASGNSLTIGGQTIFIDLSKVSEFEQKGVLTVGTFAKVEGIVEGDSFFAEEINIIGTGQGRFKFEIKGLATSTLPSPSPSPPPSLSPSPSPSPSPEVLPEATSSANVDVKIKAVGSFDQVVAFLEQILAFLKNLVI